MPYSKTKLASSFLIGAVVGVPAAYLLYTKLFRSTNTDETDEGIGDVDSIVSEGEVLAHERLLSASSETASEKQSTVSIPTKWKNSDHEYIDALESVEVEEVTEQPDESSMVEEFLLEDQNLSCDHDSFSSNGENKMSRPQKVLVLGLDGSGKSSLLSLLAKRPATKKYGPTQGFNAVQIERDEVALSIMEVGGNSSTRKYWKNFTTDTSLLIYVIDGADHAKIEEAKEELKQLLIAATIKDIPCLLISNKQDLPECRKSSEVFNKKDIKDIGKTGNCNITLLDTSFLSNNHNDSTLGETVLTVITSLLQG